MSRTLNIFAVLSLSMIVLLVVGCGTPKSPPPPPIAAVALPPKCLVGDGAIKPIQRRFPIYPPAAEDQHLTGDVSFQFTIEPDGSVADAKILSEIPAGYGFGQAALDAIQRSRFCPKLVNGVAVPSQRSEKFHTAWLPSGH